MITRKEFKAFELECWALFLASVKGFLTFVFSLLHLFLLILLFVVRFTFTLVAEADRIVKNWVPVQPRMFGSEIGD